MNGPILSPPSQSSLRVTPESSPDPAAALQFDNAQSVPASAVLKPTSPDAARYHEVVRGDTLSAIARKYNVPLQKLLEANGLTRDSILQPEQLIFIPADR